MVTTYGGVEVEANWEKVKKLAVEIGESPTDAQLATLSKDAGFSGDTAIKMAEFLKKLYTCFDNEDAQYGGNQSSCPKIQAETWWPLMR